MLCVVKSFDLVCREIRVTYVYYGIISAKIEYPPTYFAYDLRYRDTKGKQLIVFATVPTLARLVNTELFIK